ncbi:MAG: molybdenum cofactor guanylyltransferase [Actinomycetota bacterium]|nr:molybdenum cofactor guanylyltransferase [Actinomycetota bacterium]
MRAAGLVLAGGRSSRMGVPKAALEWHGSTLLRRTCGVLQRAGLQPVVVVRAPGQELPPLPADVEVVDDPREGLGPLQGMAIGLAALADRAEVAFVCSTDLPFLHAELVRRVLRPFSHPVDGDALDVVLPVARGYPQPLSAAYRTSLAPVVAALVAADRLRPAFIFEDATVLRLDDDALLADAALRTADPTLESLVNVNERADYDAARARPAPEVTIECFGVLATRSGRGPRAARAATVGAAARAVDLVLDRHVLAAVNGDQTGRDGELPLMAGDAVAFLSADAGG